MSDNVAGEGLGRPKNYDGNADSAKRDAKSALATEKSTADEVIQRRSLPKV
jgi:hypothetical protein